MILFVSIAAKAQQPNIDSVKLKSLITEASKAALVGNYDTAATLAKQIIAMGARDSSFYYLTAIVLALDGKKEEARYYYDTALAKGYDPNTTNAAMLGLNKPFEAKTLNLDSAFAAIHADAIQKSKHLPKGYKDATLYQIYQEDQGERFLMIKVGMDKFMQAGGITRMVQHDAARKKEIYTLLPKLKKSRSTEDIQEAALILQHGDDTTDYWNAHELAMRAIKLGDTTARQLAAITLDRYLVAEGKPQRYGTQAHKNEKTGKWELDPVDPSVTDAERAKWDEPPLKDQLKRLEAVYGK
ncbi:MAG: DUF6624 domain-containing protein [Candidatus Kapaibacterium sp.]